MEWGTIMRTARKRVGLTQGELAEKMYVTKSVISKYENSYHEPKISILIDWFRHTNAQDLMIATILSVDPVLVADLLSSLLAPIGAMISILF